MVIKDRPAKVSSVSTSKTGKHGSAKCNFTAIDIFNGKKYEDIQPSTATVAVPNIKRKEYNLVDISAEGFCTLMDEDGGIREDIKLPEFPDNFGREIKTEFETGKDLTVIVLSAMGHDQIVEKKETVEEKTGKKKE
jgi:translation initiation factor 5A